MPSPGTPVLAIPTENAQTAPSNHRQSDICKSTALPTPTTRRACTPQNRGSAGGAAPAAGGGHGDAGRGPAHVHVVGAAAKLVEHLGEAFVAGLFALGSRDPADVVVALVGRALAIGRHQGRPRQR